MQLDRKEIESSLTSKGFETDNSHHRYFHHSYQGKRTGISTFTSHGSSYKTYNDTLLKKMQKQLKLDTKKQLSDLIKCPISKEDYNNILIEKGLI